LESGTATLEESMRLWERGEALAARCQEWLDGAREKLTAAQADAAEAAQTAPTEPTAESPSASAASAPHPAFPLGVVTQRPQEVDAPELGPIGLAEVVLGMHRLPQQEPAEPLLAGGADDEVGVGLALGVQMFGDRFDGERLGRLARR